MKRHLALSTIGLILVALHGFAREPQAPPSPQATERTGTIGKGADGGSLFFGHYGEVLELPLNWTADAEMRGVTEVVYIHRKSHDDFGFKPFNPKPADYKLENFAPMGLIELVVIPKNAPGGLGGLDAIRRAKESELKRLGVEYAIFVEPNEDDWPLGTFHVRTKKPYRLWQTYTQSATEFYFLTYGDLAAGDIGLSQARVPDYHYANGVVSRSLGLSLAAARDKTIVGRLFERVSATPDFLEDMRPLRTAGIILGLCMAPMLVLAFWPAKSPFGRRARLYGKCLLLFSLASTLLGFLIVYVPARAAGLVWRRPEAALVAAAVWTPLIAWAAAGYFGSAHTKRILFVTCALAASWCALMMPGSQSSSFTLTSYLLPRIILGTFLTGIVFATGFALAFGKPAVGAGESR